MSMFVEKREDNVMEDTGSDILTALLNRDTMTREKALEIPTVAASIRLIADTVSSLPIKLYRKLPDGSTEEVTDDIRVKLLNQDTGDTLSPNQMRSAIIEDYFLGKGGLVYINKVRGKVKSLHYVRDVEWSYQKNYDPIFKTYTINIQGKQYQPYEFIKVLRNTKDGVTGKSVIEENSLAFNVAYNTLVFENKLIQKGGAKGGFLKSETNLAKDKIDALKEAWGNLYSNTSTDKVVVLNKGLEFQPIDATSTELQLNENKETNSRELSMLFGVPISLLKGGGGTAAVEDIKNFVSYCIVPIVNDLESALDRDLLLEKEKATMYFAVDTTALTRGDIKDRYEAYKTGLEAGFLQIDEVRKAEDLNALNMDWIKLGLEAVLYNAADNTIFVPNTGQYIKMGENIIPQEQSEGGENTID